MLLNGLSIFHLFKARIANAISCFKLLKKIVFMKNLWIVLFENLRLIFRKLFYHFQWYFIPFPTCLKTYTYIYIGLYIYIYTTVAVQWLTLRALRYTIVFFTTWSCVSLPPPTTSSGWKILASVLFESQHRSTIFKSCWLMSRFIYYMFRSCADKKCKNPEYNK